MGNKFNKERREGLARCLDTLGVSALVAAFVGASKYSPISSLEVVGLVVLGFVSVTGGFFTRKD